MRTGRDDPSALPGTTVGHIGVGSEQKRKERVKFCEHFLCIRCIMGVNKS